MFLQGLLKINWQTQSTVNEYPKNPSPDLIISISLDDASALTYIDIQNMVIKITTLYYSLNTLLNNMSGKEVGICYEVKYDDVMFPYQLTN